MFAEYVNGELTYLDPTYSAPKRSSIAAPMVIRDIGAYRSPLDGTVITTRSQHREHMQRHDVIEVGNEKIGSMQAPAAPKIDRELGEAIKRRLDEVAELPQREYDAHVDTQQNEHAEVASLITAG